MLRLLNRHRGAPRPPQAPRRAEHHDAVGWNDSAGALFEGADIVEFDGDSGEALLHELFSEPPKDPSRGRG